MIKIRIKKDHKAIIKDSKNIVRDFKEYSVACGKVTTDKDIVYIGCAR